MYRVQYYSQPLAIFHPYSVLCVYACLYVCICEQSDTEIITMSVCDSMHLLCMLYSTPKEEMQVLSIINGVGICV